MNFRMTAAVSVLAAGAMLAGCGSDTSTTTTTKPSAGTGGAAPTAATPAAGDVAAALKVSAEKLLTDATQYVKDNKFDLADKAVAELQTMKPQLPAEYGPRIDQLKSALDAAKAAAAKMPAGMKMPQ